MTFKEFWEVAPWQNDCIVDKGNDILFEGKLNSNTPHFLFDERVAYFEIDNNYAGNKVSKITLRIHLDF